MRKVRIKIPLLLGQMRVRFRVTVSSPSSLNPKTLKRLSTKKKQERQKRKNLLLS